MFVSGDKAQNRTLTKYSIYGIIGMYREILSIICNLLLSIFHNSLRHLGLDNALSRVALDGQ
jgi:hypothetical protein